MGCNGSKGAEESQTAPLRIVVRPPTPPHERVAKPAEVVVPLRRAPQQSSKESSKERARTNGTEVASEEVPPAASSPGPAGDAASAAVTLPDGSQSPSALLMASQMNELTQSNLRLLDRLDLSTARVESAQADQAATALELTRVKQELADARLQQASNSNDGQGEYLARIQAELTDSKSKLSDALSRLDDRTAAYDTLMSRFSESQSLLHSVQQSHKQLLEEHSALQAQCRATESNLSSSQRENQVSIGFTAELRAHLQSMEAQQAADATASKLEITQMQQKYMSSQAEMHALTQELQSSKAQVDDLQRRLAQSAADLARATEVAVEAKREVAAIAASRANQETRSGRSSKRSSQQNSPATGPITGSSPRPVPAATIITTSSTSAAAAVSSAPTPDASSSLHSSLDGDAEFARWLAQKKANERAPRTTNAPPPSTTLSTSASAAQLSSRANADAAISRSDVFPTAESEVEFHSWLRAEQAKEEAAAATSQRSTSSKKAPAAAADDDAPAYTQSREGEAEFAAWLAAQPPGAAAVGTRAGDVKSHHMPVASWSHFGASTDPSPLSVQPPQRRAWKDAASSSADVKGQIASAASGGRSNTDSGRRPAHTGTQSTAVLPSWAEAKSQAASSTEPPQHLGAVHAAYASKDKLSASLATPQSPSGSASARTPAVKASPPNWSLDRVPSSPVVGAQRASVSPLSFLPVQPVLWLRGDTLLADPQVEATRRVTTWQDVSPQGNHAVVCSQSNRAVFHPAHTVFNGLPVLDLCGGTALRLTRALTLSHFTLFLVCKVSGQFPYVLGGSYGVHLPCFASAAAPQLVTRKSTTTLSDAKAAGGYAVATFVRRARIKAFMHGHDVTSGGASDANDITIEFVGQIVDESGPALASPAAIAEIILFEHALEDADRIKVDQYLAGKYRK